MIDLKLTNDWDLDINALGDFFPTASVAQAVTIRLKWFLAEWRLGPAFGFPYYEEVFIKNPNLTKIRGDLRDLVMGVEGVTDVTRIEIDPNPETRRANVRIAFLVGKDAEEVKIQWQTMA